MSQQIPPSFDELGARFPQLTVLSDPADPRVADYTSLTDVSLRRKLEPERGMYLAESSKVLRRALAAGHQPRSFFMSRKWVLDLADVLDAHPEVPLYVGEDEVLESVTGFHLHRGALAAMQRPEPLPLASVLASSQRVAIVEDVVDHTNVCGPKTYHQQAAPDMGRRRRIAVLEGLTDHANVGSAFRNAAALGFDSVLVSPDCADPLYRRAVRVSMGTVFQVPWTRFEAWPQGIELLQDEGYVVAGMTLGAGAITLDQLVEEDHEKLAIVLGSEGHGITPKVDRRLDRRVTIPMMNGVDSLNVAAASAVAFYATR